MSLFATRPEEGGCGLRALYLLTATAREYSLRRGFEVIDRREVPAGIVALPQFKSLCPVTATCMRMHIGGLIGPSSDPPTERS